MTAIERIETSVFTVPLDEAESDGTLRWDRTTLAVVQAHAGGEVGLGYTYGPAACAAVARDMLADVVVGREATDIQGAWTAMVRAIRNAGRPGIASMAIAAVDVALWDLKGKLLGLPLFRLLGAVRDEVPVYASGGFTSLSERAIEGSFARWVLEGGFPRAKMKIGLDGGSDPHRDLDRVAIARKALGPSVELFVDANGAYDRKQAIRVGRSLPSEGVTWFEEPVSSDDLDGLREVRNAIDTDVAAGEYAYDLFGFRRLLPCVDVLQADASRCAGISEWLRASALAASAGIEVSGHTAQSIHLHAACAVPNIRHLEYFADHERVERSLFDGVVEPDAGVLRPDGDRPGLGITLKTAEAAPYRQE